MKGSDNEIPDAIKKPQMSMREGIGRGLLAFGSGQGLQAKDFKGAPSKPIDPMNPEVKSPPPVAQTPGINPGNGQMGSFHGGMPPYGAGSRMWNSVSSYSDAEDPRKPLRRTPFMNY